MVLSLFNTSTLYASNASKKMWGMIRSVYAMQPNLTDQFEDLLRIAHMILESQPKRPGQHQRLVIPLTSKHHIEAITDGEDLRIVGLFGRKLGSGSYGIVVQRLDLMNQKWATCSEAVLKIPIKMRGSAEHLENEIRILNILHQNGIILGLQSPVTRVVTRTHCSKAVREDRGLHDDNDPRSRFDLKLKMEDQEIVMHKGPMYEYDLYDILFEADEVSLSHIDRLSLLYQMFHALVHMHDLNVTSGDLKPENIFVNIVENSMYRIRVYIGDLGGSFDHAAMSPENYPPPMVTYINGRKIYVYAAQTLRVRHIEDNELFYHQVEEEKKRAAQGERRELLACEVEKKGDVTAACLIACETFFGPCSWEDDDGLMKIRQGIHSGLTKKGLKSTTIKLMMSGLNRDVEKRPDAKTLLFAIYRELKSRDSSLASYLVGMSTRKIQDEINGLS